MGEVAVHLDEGVVASIEPPGKTRPVGGAEAGLGLSHEHVDLADALTHLGGDRGGSVGTRVVDDQDVTGWNYVS